MVGPGDRRLRARRGRCVLQRHDRLAFLALGLTLPGLLLQDSWRYAFFALGRGSQAFLNDTVWTLAMLPALASCGSRTTAPCSGSSSPGGWRRRWRPAWGRSRPGSCPACPAWKWVSTHRDLGPRYLAENTANSGSGQLRIYGVGLIAGLAAVGYVQAGGLLMGPFLVVFMGISLVTVPEAARILRRSPHRLQLYCLVVGAALSSWAWLWGVLLVALPRGLGDLLLGRTVGPAYALVCRSRSRSWAAASQRRHGGPACPRRRAAEPARDDHRVGRLPSALACPAAPFRRRARTVRGAAIATWVGALVWWWQLRLAIRESDQIPDESGWWPRRQDGRRVSPAQALTRWRGAGARQPDPPTAPSGQSEAA